MTPSDGSAVPYLQLVRAPNPGPMTLDGTNTWVIVDQDEGALVVDPGPAIQAHLDAILAACAPRLATIVLHTGILITQRVHRCLPSELVAAYGPPICNSA